MKNLNLSLLFWENRFAAGLVIVICLASPKIHAQVDTIGKSPYSLVKINFEKHRLEPIYLPFDVPFVLAVPAPDSLGIDSILVQCFKGKNGGLVFSIPLMKDMFFRDTLYANIPVTLHPITNYNFSFTIYRGITKKEDSILSGLLRPIISGNLNGIYNNFPYPDSLNKYLKKGVSIPLLRDSIRNVYTSYFKNKRLDIKDTIRRVIDSAKVVEFIAHNFRGPLSLKSNSAKSLMNEVAAADTIFATNSVAGANLYDWRLFKTLSDSAAKFLLIDNSTKIFISDTLRVADAFTNSLHGKPKEFYSNPWDIWENRIFSTKDIGRFVIVSDSFTWKCRNIGNLLIKIKNDPTLMGIFNSLHLDIIAKNEIDSFNNKFLPRLLRINNNIHIYFTECSNLDDLFANNSFHLDTEFKLDFKDGTVGLTSADFVTRGEWYIVADIGFAYINTSPTGQIRPYVGVNFNIFPINRQVNYSIFGRSHAGYTFMGNFLRGLSISVGLSVFNAFSAKDRYTDVFGTTGSPLSGISLRITDGVRVTGGLCWVYRKDADPVSDKKYFSGLGYGAVSIDLDLKKWLRGFGSAFFK